MALSRSSTIKQLKRIMADIRKQGGDISDVKYTGTSSPNNTWDDNPIDEERYKIPTIDAHMTIDIPDNDVEIKQDKKKKNSKNKKNEMNILNFEDYILSEAFTIWQEKDKELTTLQTVEADRPANVTVPMQIGFVGKPIEVKGEKGIIMRINKDSVTVEVKDGIEKEFSFKEILKSYTPAKMKKEDEENITDIVGNIPDEKTKDVEKNHKDMTTSKAKNNLQTNPDTSKPEKTNKNIYSKVLKIKDIKDINNAKDKTKILKLKRFK